jgi:hypothetical protein
MPDCQSNFAGSMLEVHKNARFDLRSCTPRRRVAIAQYPESEQDFFVRRIAGPLARILRLNS